MKTILKIVVGIVVACVILIGGLIALLGGAAHEVQKDSDAHSITPAQFKQTKKGTTLDAVKKALGEPSDKQHSEFKGMKDSDCIYYNKRGEVADLYQFCFDGGKLTSKSAY